MATSPRTLFEKIWARHLVAEREDGQCLLYVDRHLIHEGSRRGFDILRARGLPVRRPDLTFGLPDHFVSTGHGTPSEAAQEMLRLFRANTATAGIAVFELDTPHHGIVHVVGPEAGLSLPGALLVCGDSHTATHGAIGAIAFGIGASEVAHVLASQTIWQKRPKLMRIRVEGRLGAGVGAKDLALALIARIGTAGGTGHAIEFAGPAIEALSVEGRLTLCNMAIEAGARFGLIAPDEKTIAWLRGRAYAPTGAGWEQAVAQWRALRSDADATFDRDIAFDATEVAPMMTWGTSPEDAMPITGHVPDPDSYVDTDRAAAVRQSLAYMGLRAGQPVAEIAFDRVFIGSCTNARIEDLRLASSVVRGRKARIPAMVVPGSAEVKRQAEAEGLADIFRAAGFSWGTPGCSMCVGLNGDLVAAGTRCASTSNRNFVGRQGAGARTHLMGPALAASVAIHGTAVAPEMS